MRRRIAAALALVAVATATVTLVGPEPVSGTDGGPTAPARWDHANLTYWVESGIGAPERQVVREVVAAWQRSGVVSFTEVTDAAEADLELAWSTYGPDGADLPTCAAAQGLSFGPGEPRAGHVTFNGDCAWGSTTSLAQVATREIGHALGLGYSSDPASALFRTYRDGGPTAPTDADLDRLRRLHGASRFVGVDPVRVLDTRNGTGMPAGVVQRLGPGQHLDLWIAGGDVAPVPASASAVVLNVTATAATAASFLAVYPSGARPEASNLQVVPGRTVAVLTTTKVDHHGWVSLYNNAGTVDVVADLAGYYTTETSGGAGLTGITPTRLLDTRAGPGPVGALGAGATVDLRVAGSGGIPLDASSAVLNVTATAATGDGFVTVLPSGTARAAVSNLNTSPGTTVANLVTVRLGTDGGVRLFNSAASVHLVVDVVAYYTPAGGQEYVATDPERILDTRSAQAPVGPGSSVPLRPSSSRHVPATAMTLVATTTATATTGAGFVTLYPEGGTRPFTSNLNTTPGETVSNLTVSKIGTGGTLRLYNSSGSTHLVVDSAGYFTARGAAPAGTGVGSRPGAPTGGAGTPPAPRPAEPDTRWDHENLTYWISNGVGDAERAAILESFEAWQRSGVVSFREVDDRTAADLRIVFYTHTRDGRQFSRCSSEPAVSYGPAANLRGEIDLNGYCAWVTVAGATGYDLGTITAREIGHALGLGYGSVEEASVMAPVYHGPRRPTAGDLQRLRRLYGATRFVATTPARLLDTREDGRRLGPGTRFDLMVAGAAPVPATASAVVLSVTATDATASGWLSVFPADTARPSTSTLNTLPGRNVTNSATVRLSANGSVALFNSSGSVDVVADVTGYYTTEAGAGAGFSPTVPSRVLDTRGGTGPRGIVTAGGTVDLTVTGTAGVPSGATAVLVNVTSAEAESPLYVSVHPSGTPRPVSSNVSADAGRTVGTLVTAKPGAGGRITLFASGRTHLVVDVVGYFTAAGGADFVPVTPVRAFDEVLAHQSVRTVDPSLGARVPTGAVGIVANLTATDATGDTFLTVWPDGSVRPPASNLNLGPGRAVANQVAVGTGDDGLVHIWNNNGSARVVVDVAGYFAS